LLNVPLDEAGQRGLGSKRIEAILIEFGPHDPDDPEAIGSDGETILSDPECESCVEFIYSHMVKPIQRQIR
jgi:hypothetical protein